MRVVSVAGKRIHPCNAANTTMLFVRSVVLAHNGLLMLKAPNLNPSLSSFVGTRGKELDHEVRARCRALGTETGETRGVENLEENWQDEQHSEQDIKSNLDAVMGAGFGFQW